MFAPIELGVAYRLTSEFRTLVGSNPGCKITKVTELISGPNGVLIFHIECPKELENTITDYAFMTWIKNPVFQKYYHGTKAFEKIAEEYLKERTDQVA